MIQDTMFWRIRARYVPLHGLEGPPEQEIDVTAAIPHAIDKWAQSSVHQKKAEVGWPHRLKSATWRPLIGCLSRFFEE